MDVCVLCKKKTDEKTVCPAKSTVPSNSYSNIAKNISMFTKINQLPLNINIADMDEGEGIESYFKKHKSSWHKSCANLFSNLKLDRASKRNNASFKTKKTSSSSTGTIKKTTRQKKTLNENVCVFCDLRGPRRNPLHYVETLETSSRIINHAIEIQHTILKKVNNTSDLIASEFKYHLACLSAFYRERPPTDICETNVNSEDPDNNIQSLALSMVIQNMTHEAQNNEKYIFYLKNIVNEYAENLKSLSPEMDTTVNVNCTKLKNRLLKLMPHLQEGKDGKLVILFYPESIANALKLYQEFNNDEEALCLLKAANILRKRALSSRYCFSGNLKEAELEIPPEISYFFTTLLRGSFDNSKPNDKSVSTLSQLTVFNLSGKRNPNSTIVRHYKENENPLVIYIAAKLFSETRQKKLINSFHDLGLCVSYKRMQMITTALTNSTISFYEKEDCVIAPNMHTNIFTTLAVDNVDYNPSSTGAASSFHGTAISVQQHPTKDCPGEKINYEPNLKLASTNTVKSIPDFYSIVPVHELKSKNVFYRTESLELPGVHDNCTVLKESSDWLANCRNILDKTNDVHDRFSWAAFYASQCTEVLPKAKICLLPLFYEVAHTAAMIRHALIIAKSVTNYCNSGQVSVIEMDQPLYALAKQLQFQSAELGEDQIVVMLGGLHTEMALWAAIGALLDGSGIVNILIDSEVLTSGRADAFLKVSHLTRTRRTHQELCISLYYLLTEAHAASATNLNLDKWCDEMCKKVPVFSFWMTILNFQLKILRFIRSLRTADFNLYVESIGDLLSYFFALDRTNYARWLSVHYRDMFILKEKHPHIYNEFCKGGFVVQKSSNRFSSIPIDQCHEQENAVIKGVAGAIGLTENPKALRRWLISGPDIARLIGEYEDCAVFDENKHKHHEESPTLQEKFISAVTNIIDTFKAYGNPFLENATELFAIDSKIVVDAKCLEILLPKGINQCNEFFQERLINSNKSISEPIIKNNNIPFKSKKNSQKKSSKEGELKSDVDLFSRLYIASQNRDGDIENFFKFENHPYPPSLSQLGQMYHGTKSDFLRCIDKYITATDKPTEFDAKLLDGAALIHILQPKACSNFEEYITSILKPYVLRIFETTQRVDLVWDMYIEKSLKGYTREKRGRGSRKLVRLNTAIPKNWYDFLRDELNKRELFSLISIYFNNMSLPENKVLVCNNGEETLFNSTCQNIVKITSMCNHEEADSRIFVHSLNCLSNNLKKVLIKTVDTDVVVLALFYQYLHQEQDLWLEFGVGKNLKYISCMEICSKLNDKCLALPMFHAFSGSDVTSAFFGKGKRKCWEAWESFPDITNTFKELTLHPKEPSAQQLRMLAKFVTFLYDKHTECESLDVCRMELFSKKNRSIENLPPTFNALSMHTRRCIFQAGFVWGQLTNTNVILPCPSDWGWKLEHNKWLPVWTTIKNTKLLTETLIKCNCKICDHKCKCFAKNLKCTELCTCKECCN